MKKMQQKQIKNTIFIGVDIQTLLLIYRLHSTLKWTIKTKKTLNLLRMQWKKI